MRFWMTLEARGSPPLVVKHKQLCSLTGLAVLSSYEPYLFKQFHLFVQFKLYVPCTEIIIIFGHFV